MARTRDLVVIGCSAGGGEALPRIVQQLPANLPASVFVVQHMSASSKRYLVEILQRTTKLPVEWAEQGQRLQRGHVYVAPPDVHTLFADEHISLLRSARENHARPSIDKLFRSAAAVHGSRVIGVLLTGMLEDGVAGLHAIRDAGGIVIVQDPSDAQFPELPARAAESLRPDRVLPIDRIAAALTELVGQEVALRAVPELVSAEANIDRVPIPPPDALARLGPQSSISCPECGGPTWEIGDETNRRYRCYLGHVTTARQLLHQGAIEVESALWSAIRALNERAMTLETLARDAETLGHAPITASYAARARDVRRQAELVRRFIEDVTQPR